MLILDGLAAGEVLDCGRGRCVDRRPVPSRRRTAGWDASGRGSAAAHAGAFAAVRAPARWMLRGGSPPWLARSGRLCVSVATGSRSGRRIAIRPLMRVRPGIWSGAAGWAWRFVIVACEFTRKQHRACTAFPSVACVVCDDTSAQAPPLKRPSASAAPSATSVRSSSQPLRRSGPTATSIPTRACKPGGASPSSKRRSASQVRRFGTSCEPACSSWMRLTAPLSVRPMAKRSVRSAQLRASSSSKGSWILGGWWRPRQTRSSAADERRHRIPPPP